MGIYELILKRRTIRKFEQKKIDKKILLDCLNAARLAPSSRNKQPLEYILITKNLDKIFNSIKMAGYLKDAAPTQNEKPMAYIVIILNTKISDDAKYDVGLAAENIILTAFEKGIASCPIKSIDINKLMKILNIPENYIIEIIIALGYPKQKSVEDEFKKDSKYWLDKKDVLHIPKRRLKDIVHEEEF